MENFNSPDFTLPIVTDMKVNWTKITDISSGTAHFKAKGQTYLPKEPKETDDSYKVRLSRAILFNVFNKTVDALSGVAFLKPPRLGDDVPAQIADYSEDIDLQGNSFAVFSKRLFDDAVRNGVTYAYVQSPNVEDEVNSRADEVRLNIRPYWVHVKAENVLNWRYITVGGKQYRKGLQMACMQCHTSKEKFCDTCHDYTSVKPFCWDCHLTPEEAALKKETH